MFGPVRLWYALRDHADSGLLAAAVAVAVLFAATPFLIPAVAADYGVALGTAGLLSTAQVGGFAVSAFVAGRTLSTRRVYLVAAAAAAVMINLVSTVVPTFWLLALVRVLAGAAAGVLVWLAWANAMRTSAAMRNVAATGPLAMLVATPVLARLAETGGPDAVFVAIAAASIPAVFLPARLSGYRVAKDRISPSRSNVVLLLALGGMTLSGSSLFVFGAAVGQQELGMQPLMTSLGYSLNALAGLVAARRDADERPAGRWVLGIAASAAAVAFATHPVTFIVGMTAWGFCFWMATPAILRAIAAWSLAPGERVGDAQSAMALGRAAGPAAGAVLVGQGTFAFVGAFAVCGLLACATTVGWVTRYRTSAQPPRGTPAAAR